ncbi:MAG: YhcH/YjgK/YiaL family protein [Kiritimatiellae bacterium]|nr:YhcH/YjgK/YiaL family protein [Kiritimatiellia bacterium]
MIVDTLENADRYLGIHPLFKAAFDFLRGSDLAALPDGSISLVEPKKLYANVNTYLTKPVEEGQMEAHRRYIDIQCVAAGEEQIGWVPLTDQPETGTFDTDSDIGFYDGETSLVAMRPGQFMILFPGEGHLPCRAIGMPSHVKKIVIKVLV